LEKCSTDKSRRKSILAIGARNISHET
jgi:hypothetical protein